MSVTFSISLANCPTCNRPTDKAVSTLDLGDTDNQVLQVAGLSDDHPENVYNNISTTEMSDRLENIVDVLLSDPLKYIDLYAEFGADRFNQRGYENIVMALLEFINQCKAYPNGTILVNPYDQ